MHPGHLAVVDEQVVERDVAVHHLRRAAPPTPGATRSSKPSNAASTRRRVAGVVDVLGEPAGPVALLDVPEQPAPGSRVEEAAQRARRTGGGRAVGEDRAGRQVGAGQPRPSRQPVVGTEEVRRPGLRVPDDRVAVAPRR